jgi:5-methylthioadenosine/S-adenosylhomocysteine deaminase
VRQGTELAIAEMLRAGTTCFNEMYFFPDQIAAAAEAAGMRACIGLPVIEFETPWSKGAADCFRQARDVHDRLQGSELLGNSLAPHALYTVGDDSLEKITELSDEFGVPVHMHVLEIAWEIEHSMREYQERPLARLQRHGLLGERFLAVHMAHLTSDDIELLEKSGTRVIHCPESNLKLASGICPVAELLSAGVEVCLGTDSAASNNNLDLLGEVRTAALLAKGVSGDPCAVDAAQALELVTMAAARALGMEKQIGSIEPGKKADLCALDLVHPETQPLNHVLSQVVYSASSRQFTNVWVNGRHLLDNGRLTTVDLEKVLADAGQWNRRLAEVA